MAPTSARTTSSGWRRPTRPSPTTAGSGAGGLTANDALVRSAIDAYNRRDLEELCALMTEDVELRPPVSELTGRAYVGHAGVARWLRDVEESFASADIVPLEVVDLGDKVLVLSEFRVEGHGGRVPLGSELGLVCDVRGGRIASWLGFFNHAEAREAAGA